MVIRRKRYRETAGKIPSAIDVETGAIARALPQVGRPDSWGGVMSTAGGLVFFGDDTGSFGAADASAGERRWKFPTSRLWKASPMSYSFDGRQFVAVASRGRIAFALVE
jgi:alcohol dehydrogenase (cytochrome c)